MPSGWAGAAVKIMPKCVQRASFGCHFLNFSIRNKYPERDGSQVAFSLCFCGFLKGPTFDPLAPAQSKHSFSIFDLPFKMCNCGVLFGDIWISFATSERHVKAKPGKDKNMSSNLDIKAGQQKVVFWLVFGVWL